MNVDVYNGIVNIINNHRPFDGHSCRKVLQEKYPNVPECALRGIMSLQYQRQMKYTLNRKMSKINTLYSRYCASLNSGERPGILLRMAEEQELCPALLARGILERHYENKSENDKEVSRSYISGLMKDTNLIENHQLAYEIYLCIVHDEEYGPISNSFNHSIGVEYELKLQKAVRDLKIPFHDENHLRASGYDKTPDVKLEIPIAVDGFVVNWIESKASFGDEESHRTILKKQLLSYVNRFGTGMVIYWFGFVENIVPASEKQIIIKDDFPLEVTLMNPQCIDPSIDEYNI
ncbi:CDAN1-interacting nuclease 1 [Hetaerina americana]|uniref:CDAN1-interacting nuclease 1 n=1 Tax=Hetaerina americana TaxID=62018 RepID=UPI003A7F1038